jgi:hypothetical protein
MARGMPSLLTLLGLAAVAGYQNRDKLRDMIGSETLNPVGLIAQTIRLARPERAGASAGISPTRSGRATSPYAHCVNLSETCRVKGWPGTSK